VAELFHRLGVQLSLIGTVLLGPVRLIRAVGHDQATCNSHSSQRLYEGGSDVVLCLQPFGGIQPLSVLGEEPRPNQKREEDEQKNTRTAESHDPGAGLSPLGHTPPSHVDPRVRSAGLAAAAQDWPGHYRGVFPASPGVESQPGATAVTLCGPQSNPVAGGSSLAWTRPPILSVRISDG